MKVCGTERFSAYIYAMDHPPPHCHIRLRDGSEVCVTIPLMEPLYNGNLTRDLREEIEDRLDELTAAWDRLHPKRNKVPKKKRKTKRSTKGKEKTI